MRMQQQRVPFSLLMPHIPSESIFMIGIDPTRCPICHEPDVCAMEMAKATGSKPERCWCMDGVFTPTVMELTCVLRWKEALAASVVPPVILECTHRKALEFVKLEQLKSKD
jgi:Uncharacterized protein conserved in bacteria (DUF2237)